MAANLETPTRPLSSTQPPPPESVNIGELLMSMQSTSTIIAQNAQLLNEQSIKLSTAGPTMHNATLQLHELSQSIRSLERKQERRINDVKVLVREKLLDQVMDKLKGHIENQIKNEIGLQVSQQVSAQIKEYLPVSLEDQVAESKKQFEDVKMSLMNSEARRKNFTLRIPRDLDEQIYPVANANGQRSEKFPANLRTLFSYDVKTAKDLVRDYGLAESNVRETNLNKFMSHIGIQFSLVAIPFSNH